MSIHHQLQVQHRVKNMVCRIIRLKKQKLILERHGDLISMYNTWPLNKVAPVLIPHLEEDFKLLKTH